MLVGSIYRPPEKPLGQFLDDFHNFLEEINTYSGDILLSGDFNIHIEDKQNTQALRFLDLLDCFGLTQHVTVPTHTSNHTLDLIITRSMIPVSPPSTHSLLSDHFAVFGYFSVRKKTYETRQISLQKIKDINKATFRQDISNHQCVLTPPEDLDELVEQFDSQLRTDFDQHAPKPQKLSKFDLKIHGSTPTCLKQNRKKEDSSVSGLKVGL